MKHKIAEKNLDGVYTDEFTKEQLEKGRLGDHDSTQTIQVVSTGTDGYRGCFGVPQWFLADLAKAFIEAKTLERKRELCVQLFPQWCHFRNSTVEHLGLADWILLKR